jgi:integrase
METAVDDDIRRNPCRIDGAGKEESDERAVIPLPVVFALADTLPRWHRALVLLATFAQLRLGELAGLTRDRFDLSRCEVRVTDAKSHAGNRTVTFLAETVPELREHLARYAAPARPASSSSGQRAAGSAETTSTRSSRRLRDRQGRSGAVPRTGHARHLR